MKAAICAVTALLFLGGLYYIGAHAFEAEQPAIEGPFPQIIGLAALGIMFGPSLYRWARRGKSS